LDFEKGPKNTTLNHIESTKEFGKQKTCFVCLMFKCKEKNNQLFFSLSAGKG
jgi:hypothetical protein